MKRRLLLASLAAGLIAVAAFAGTVLAQEATEAEPESGGIYQRAAEILGVTEDDLRGAFEQAQKDIAEEHVTAHIDALVEEGVLTAEEATELKEWIESRPEALDRIVPFDGLGFIPRGPAGEFGRRFGPHFDGPHHHFRGPRIEGGLVPPGPLFERFEEMRERHGFGSIDGMGFTFEWFGPGVDDDEGEAEVTPSPTPTGDGVSA